MNTDTTSYFPIDRLLGGLVAEFGPELARLGFCLMVGCGADAGAERALVQDVGLFGRIMTARSRRASEVTYGGGMIHVAIDPAIAPAWSGGHDYVSVRSDTGESTCVYAPAKKAASVSTNAVVHTLELLERIHTVTADRMGGTNVRVLPVPHGLELSGGEVLIERPTPDGRLLWPYRPTGVSVECEMTVPAPNDEMLTGLALATRVWAAVSARGGLTPHLAGLAHLVGVFDSAFMDAVPVPTASAWPATESILLVDREDFERPRGHDAVKRAQAAHARTRVFESIEARAGGSVGFAALFLSQLAGRRVVASVFQSRAGDAHRGPHRDDADVVVVQKTGGKVFHVETSSGDVTDIPLAAGDVLLLPRVAHSADTPVESVHVQFAFIDEPMHAAAGHA